METNRILLRGIGDTIHERRQALRITQPMLAELAGISVDTLYRIEKGDANPTILLMDKLASVLGLELSLVVKKIKN